MEPVEMLMYLNEVAGKNGVGIHFNMSADGKKYYRLQFPGTNIGDWCTVHKPCSVIQS